MKRIVSIFLFMGCGLSALKKFETKGNDMPNTLIPQVEDSNKQLARTMTMVPWFTQLLAGKKAVIWDHDNTLADTEKLWLIGVNNLLSKKYQIIATQEQQEAFFHQTLGMTLGQAADVLNNFFNLNMQKEVLIEQWRHEIQKLYVTDLSFVSHVPRVLAALKERKIKMAIASNSDPRLLDYSVARLGLDAYFKPDTILNASHVEQGKPAPDLYLLALKRLGVSPDEVIVFEDSPPGIEAALNAQIKDVIAINMSGNRQAIEKASIIINCFSELFESDKP